MSPKKKLNKKEDSSSSKTETWPFETNPSIPIPGKVDLLEIPVIKFSLNECKRYQRIEELVKELFKLLDKKKPKGKEHPTVAELRKLAGA